MTDIRDRNRAISGSYARLYQSSPDLKWAGAAAFASKQVGCGMDTAHTYLDNYPGGIEAATRDLANSGSAIDPATLTMYDARQTLAAGNLAVYDELYPALRFYQQNNNSMSKDQILACMSHKPPPPLDLSITRGLKQIMDGNPNGGALTMLRHEQFDTLQNVAYDKSWLFRRSLDLSRLTGYPPITFVVSAACMSSDPAYVVNFKDFGGALYDPDKRWPFAQECANRFINLVDSPESSEIEIGAPASREAVNQALGEIAHGAPSP